MKNLILAGAVAIAAALIVFATFAATRKNDPAPLLGVVHP